MPATNANSLSQVNMKLRKKTLERLENLKVMLEIDNRTQVVATAVQILDELVKSVKEGGKIIIKHNDGTQESIRFLSI